MFKHELKCSNNILLIIINANLLCLYDLKISAIFLMDACMFAVDVMSFIKHPTSFTQNMCL